MTEFQIEKDGTIIGRFTDDEVGRDDAFNKFCNDKKSCYLKKEKE